jgi:protein-S-isoprenylcysteine O-methyltransferase Ste14
MTDLRRKALGGLARLVIVTAISLFLPAGTLDYWQAWVFLAVFSAATLAITLYLMKKDPQLLARRLRAGAAAEKERSQKIVQFLAAMAFVGILGFPAIDHRFAGSASSPQMTMIGDVLVGLGFLIVFLVFKENSFASATIEVGIEQKVVSTGPYAFMRHPMYLGALIMLSGVPLALGSYWGLLALLPMTLVIVWRLTEEEKYLARNLPGYCEYQKIVRSRLVPFIW